MYDVPAGFEVPVYKAPLRPKLMWGAPRDFTFGMIGLFCLGFLWKLWILLPLAVVLQLGATFCTSMDERWFQKAPRAVLYKRYYKP
jgi:type IV secretory pathway TrbD component